MRFRKTFKILPGVKITASKSGITTNVGVKGSSISHGPSGTHVNTSIPGTGLSSRKKISGANQPGNIPIAKTASLRQYQVVMVLTAAATILLLVRKVWLAAILSGIISFMCYQMITKIKAARSSPPEE